MRLVRGNGRSEGRDLENGDERRGTVNDAAGDAGASGSGKAGGSAGFSFPMGVPLLVYPLLLYAADEASGSWWAYAFHAAFFGLVAYFTRTALSRAAYQRVLASRPGLSRHAWVLNWLIFFVLLPMAAWYALFSW